MEEFDEKFKQMTIEMINYIKNDNLSKEILNFLNIDFKFEKAIKGYDFFKKIIFNLE